MKPLTVKALQQALATAPKDAKIVIALGSGKLNEEEFSLAERDATSAGTFIHVFSTTWGSDYNDVILEA